MKTYTDKISVQRNSRGIYILDTSIGCSSGMKANKGGCYEDCYVARTAKMYGHDFGKTVLRHFKSEAHKRQVVSQLSKIKMPFIRIGGSGDPSENWRHCIDVLKVIYKCNKEIVIITRHWTLLTDEQLQYISTLNICINTSVSALDSESERQRSLDQYNRIKTYCKSVLRIISCDFNMNNPIGHGLAKIQAELFENESTLDTVFRPSKTNHWVTSGIVNVKQGVFNGNKQLVSKFNRKTFTGKCSQCQQMCGVNIDGQHNYSPSYSIVKQLSLV